MELPQDPIAQLQADHRTVEKLYGQFKTATGEEKRRALEEIVRELSVHAVVEEQAVYPAMRAALPDGDSLVEHAVEEHQHVTEALAQLDGADPEDEQVAATVRDMMREVMAHVAEEEEDLLPQLRQLAGPDLYTEMAENAERARASAPTRPHPHAPSGGGAGQAVAGAVAGAVDKARDKVRDAVRN